MNSLTGCRIIVVYNSYDNNVEIEDVNEKGLSDEDFDRMMRSGKRYFFFFIETILKKKFLATTATTKLI
ncbi:MAG: hypothetical protein LBD56_02405 [Endomicrobium sp.]|nr:hypothetical protein [Endomicrobium sp.]